jgi:hypothetical protein
MREPHDANRLRLTHVREVPARTALDDASRLLVGEWRELQAPHADERREQRHRDYTGLFADRAAQLAQRIGEIGPLGGRPERLELADSQLTTIGPAKAEPATAAADGPHSGWTDRYADAVPQQPR